jgi:hypothetical protein
LGGIAVIELKDKLASLLNSVADEIVLEVIDAGLTHESYVCTVEKNKYYIKIYNNIDNISNVIGYINQLTEYMRGRGLPASRLHAYSPAFANIVVHEFVEGEMHAGKLSQTPAIAELCSRIILVGADHGRQVSRQSYFAGIHEVAEQMRTMENRTPLVDPAVHTGMQAVTRSVLACLEAEITDAELLHVHVHDDFTEKNILLQGDQVKLLCDWDSCRLKFMAEYLACSAARFSTERPLHGLLQKDKLCHFLNSVDPRVVRLISSVSEFASLFACAATLKHLRTYAFRHSRVSLERPDLRIPLLQWPLQHCEWLLENRHRVGEWVYEALAERRSAV